MKVTLINHSDSRGGASVVSYRLLRALCEQGIDARMVVCERTTGDLRVATPSGRAATRLAFLADTAANFMANGLRRDTLFKIDTARAGLPLWRHPYVVDADVVMLNWINQGMLSLSGIHRIADMHPIVWTMHDLWPMTGVCHHPGQCTRFTDECGCCPMLRWRRSRDASHASFKRKQALYSRHKISFVAVSSWVARQAAASALLRNAQVSVIGNAFPLDEFPIEPTYSRPQLGLPTEGSLVVIGAARLDDPIKNLPLAIDVLNRAGHLSGGRVHAVLFGNIRNPHALDDLTIPYTWLGPVSDRRRLASVYAHSTVVLSTSHRESLPGTLLEGISAGCRAVTTGCGGQRDIVAGPNEGFVLDADAELQVGTPLGSQSADTLAQAIVDTIDHPADRAALHRSAARFAADRIAAQYIPIFEHLTVKNDSLL